MNAFWRDPEIRGLAVNTRRRYARSLRVWLNFLTAVGVWWDRASRSDLAAFKEWRLSTEDNPKHVAPNSFCLDQTAIRRFYGWAAMQHGIENPVRVRVIGETFFGSRGWRWRARRPESGGRV
ncbi:site-specific integrase [Nocardia sp. NPDC050710]|uniref:site-specific integrase n=1 Tax=Nocardia sp. NPDC050710 TaxID=3157220 RepID=UPI00340F9E65